MPRDNTAITDDMLPPSTSAMSIVTKLPDGAAVLFRATANMASTLRRVGIQIQERTVTVVDRQTGDAMKCVLIRRVSGRPRKTAGPLPRVKTMRVVKRMLAGETNEQIAEAENLSLRNIRATRDAALAADLIGK